MGTAVKITREDEDPAALRRLAAKSADAEQSRRLLAIAMIKDGASREEAARMTGMDRQTLRDWVQRYNLNGPDGLVSRKPPGAAAKLSSEDMQALRKLTLDGPDLERHSVVRWRCCDLRDEIARTFEVEVCERTVGKWLRKLDLTRLQPRPHHPRKSAEAQETFKKTSTRL